MFKTQVTVTNWLKQAAFILPTGAAVWGLLGVFSVVNAQIDMKLRSEQFEQLCSQPIPTECKDIGKAAHITTELIYELFEAERVRDENKRSDVINQITQLYKAEQIDIVNKRLKLSDFFKVEDDKVFGGYAVLIRSRKIQKNKRLKVSYTVAFKGVYNSLEDPNDIAASISGLPANLPKNAGVLIHQGFSHYAGSVFNDSKSRELLSEILNLQNRENTDLEILITGHSLGGAAILYAAMLTDAGVLPSNIKVVVFGSSPVAQQSFAHRYRELITKITRVENEGDMLIYEEDSPMKPIYDSLGYVPFGRLIKARATEKLISLNMQKIDLEKKMQDSPTQDMLTAYLNLTQQILEERVAIHVYSYRYYSQYYRAVSADINP
ncbi:MAG: lipase [Xenococcaceae cyanobacterium]